MIDIFVLRRLDACAAQRFFAMALKGQGDAPNRLTTDKLSCYPPAIRDVMPESVHDTSQYANNRAERSHQPIRQRRRPAEGWAAQQRINHRLRDDSSAALHD